MARPQLVGCISELKVLDEFPVPYVSMSNKMLLSSKRKLESNECSIDHLPTETWHSLPNETMAERHLTSDSDEIGALQAYSQFPNACKSTKRKHSTITIEEDFKLCDQQESMLYKWHSLTGTPLDLFHRGERCFSYGHIMEGLRYFRLAADEGQADAQCYLGKLFKEGTHVPHDPVQSFQWFHRAAEQDNVEAQLEVGLCYHHGVGTNQRLDEAHRLFRLVADTAADANTNIRASAWFWLAECHRYGVGVETKLSNAVRLYKLSAAQGHDQAQLRLDHCFKQDIGVDREIDFADASRRLAERNTAEAQVELGVCYYYGISTQKQYSEAFRLFRSAAESNNASAQYWLGRCYYWGKGVKKDLKEAVRFYGLAADQGYARAQHLLGYCFGEGMGVERDFAAALKWHRLAAQQNNAYSFNNLGVMYSDGDGVSRDYVEAVRYFQLAVDKDDTTGYAYCNLGECYGFGRGVARDLTEALRLYRTAACYGDEDAADKVQELEAAMK